MAHHDHQGYHHHNHRHNHHHNHHHHNQRQSPQPQTNISTSVSAPPRALVRHNILHHLTDTYDFSPFLSAPAVAHLAQKTGGPVIINIPETSIPSPLASNIAPSTLYDLKEYLCGKDDYASHRNEGSWRGELGQGLKRTFDFMARIGENIGGGGDERKKWGDMFGAERGKKQGKEVWESWKRAFDLWNNYYIEGREDPVWIKSEYEKLKKENEEERARRIHNDRPRGTRSRFGHRGPPLGSQGFGSIRSLRSNRPVPSQGGIAIDVPAGNPAVPVQPGGQPVFPGKIYRTKVSPKQPTDAEKGRMWRLSHEKGIALKPTGNIHSSKSDDTIQRATKKRGRKQRPGTVAIEKQIDEEAIIWRESPMYDEVVYEKIIRLSDQSVIVDWRTAPIDTSTLSLSQRNALSSNVGIVRKTEYMRVKDHVHVDHSIKDPKNPKMIYPSRPLEEVDVMELWDTGEKRMIVDQPESVYGEDLTDGEEIISTPILTSSKLEIHIYKPAEELLWEEVDITDTQAPTLAPTHSHAMANLRTSPRKSTIRSQKTRRHMYSPAHTVQNQSTGLWSSEMSTDSRVTTTNTAEEQLSLPKKLAVMGPMFDGAPQLRGGYGHDGDELFGDDDTEMFSDTGDNPPPVEISLDNGMMTTDPTEDPIQLQDPIVEGASGGFMPMKELLNYKTLVIARKRYAAQSDSDVSNRVSPSELDDILSNSVWRPRRVGESKLKIDIDEDIEEFFANTDLEVDGGVDCGRSPYPVLRSVVHYFRREGKNRDEARYYKKRIWDGVRGTLFNMPTRSEEPDQRTEDEELANDMFGEFYRDENLAGHFERHRAKHHDLFPLDIRRCDRVSRTTNQLQPQPKPRPEDSGDTAERIEYPWNSYAKKQPDMSQTDPWWVTEEEKRNRDMPPRRYPPKQYNCKTGEILHCDDTLWRHEVDRDEHFDSAYFVTNLHGGKLIINGQEIKKGQIAGPLPLFAVIETQGGQISFWWGVDGRDWGEGEPMDYSSHWRTLRAIPGWEKVGLTAGQVWDMIIKDRLAREATGDKQADDEQWERWKSAVIGESDNDEEKAREHEKRLKLSYWNGDGKKPERLYEFSQPECFSSELNELQWLYTRAEPLHTTVKDLKRQGLANIIIPDVKSLWAGTEGSYQPWQQTKGEEEQPVFIPAEIVAQESAEKHWAASKNKILKDHTIFARQLEQQKEQRQAAAQQALTAATAVANNKRRADDEIGRPDPKRVRLDVEEKAKLAEAIAKARRENPQGETDLETAVREYRIRKLEDARELAPRLSGVTTVGEVEKITRIFDEEKRLQRFQEDENIKAQNAHRGGKTGLPLLRPRLLVPDSIVEDYINQKDEHLKKERSKAVAVAVAKISQAANDSVDGGDGDQGDSDADGDNIANSSDEGQAASSIDEDHPQLTTAERAAEDRRKNFQKSTAEERKAARRLRQWTNFTPPKSASRRGPVQLSTATRSVQTQLLTPATRSSPQRLQAAQPLRTTSSNALTPPPSNQSKMITTQIGTPAKAVSSIPVRSSSEEADLQVAEPTWKVKFAEKAKTINAQRDKTAPNLQNTHGQGNVVQKAKDLKAPLDLHVKLDAQLARKLQDQQDAESAQLILDAELAKTLQDAEDAKNTHAKLEKAIEDVGDLEGFSWADAIKAAEAAKAAEIAKAAKDTSLQLPPQSITNAPFSLPVFDLLRDTPSQAIADARQTKEQKLAGERESLKKRAESRGQTSEQWLASELPQYRTVDEYLNAWYSEFKREKKSSGIWNAPGKIPAVFRKFLTRDLRASMEDAAMDALEDIMDKRNLYDCDAAVRFLDRKNGTDLRTEDRYVNYHLSRLGSLDYNLKDAGNLTDREAREILHRQIKDAGNWQWRIATQPPVPQTQHLPEPDMVVITDANNDFDRAGRRPVRPAISIDL